MKTFFYFCLLFLIGLTLLTINLAGHCLLLLVGPQRCNACLRPIILNTIRFYRRLFARWKVGLFTFEGLDHASGGPRIYAANHTGLLDAIMLLIALPDAACIFKSKLRRNPFVSRIPAAIGFFANDEGYGLIRSIIRQLDEGSSVLIFPEGTRSDQSGCLNAFKTGTALVAIKSGRPVQTILIENPHGVTGKQRSLFNPPPGMPFRYHFRRGPELRPEPGETARAFTARAEACFREELWPAHDECLVHR